MQPHQHQPGTGQNLNRNPTMNRNYDFSVAGAVKEAIATDLNTTDPHRANALGRDFALLAIDRGAEAARLELGRKDLQTSIRDRIMGEKQMAKTPAEAEARTDPEYVAYCERIQAATDEAAEARAYSRYFQTRALILAAASFPALDTAEVTHG